jgi:peptidoglycan/LPS O-acetylase OafA/YrhL
LTVRRQRLGSLEIGRFIAASVVMLSHLLGVLTRHAAPGAAALGGAQCPGPLGVQYFFVLSGFVMITAHHDDFGTWRGAPNFWWRRACRIYPLYWLVLLPLIYYFYRIDPPLGQLWQWVVLNPHLVNDLDPPAWTLRFEIAFYIMLGLCMLPYAGRFILEGWVLCVLWLILPVPLVNALRLGHVYYVSVSRIGRWNFFISLFELYFFAGLLSGFLFLRWRCGPRRAVLVLVGALSLFAIGAAQSAMTFDYPPARVIPVIALGYGGIIFAFASFETLPKASKTSLKHPAAAWLGALSYPLYVVHAPMILLLDKILPNRPQEAALNATLALFLIIIYATAGLMAFAIDRPLQKRLRRRQPARA